MTENFGCNELLTWDICWGYKPEKSSSLLKVKTKQTKPWRPFPSCSACSSTWDMDLNSTILHLSRIMGPQDLKVDVGENMIKQRIVASIVQKSIWNELNSYQSPTTLELSASWCFQTWWATQETVLGNLQSLETGTWVLGSIHDGPNVFWESSITSPRGSSQQRRGKLKLSFPFLENGVHPKRRSKVMIVMPDRGVTGWMCKQVLLSIEPNSCLHDNYENGVYMNFPNDAAQSVHSHLMERYIKHINWSTFTDLNISQHCQAVNIGMSVPVAQHSGFRSFQPHPSAANRVTDICLCLTASTALSGGNNCWTACPTGEDIQTPENALAQ